MMALMYAPITYHPDFLTKLEADEAFERLRDDLDWEHRPDAPRSEYYCNDFPEPYAYGRGRGRRLYEPRPWHPVIRKIRERLEALTGTKFEVCFLNRYHDQSDQLGWHADDSPEMDDARPIASISLGVERDIMFRLTDPRTKDELPVERLKLGHGSACLMSPGMQDVWQHRIPKAGFQCGERISLTFRGYVAIPVFDGANPV